MLANGFLSIDGKIFDSPSGAGKYVKGGVTNGWYFWRLSDGRKLLDVRAAFTGTRKLTEEPARFDWSTLHAILEALPEGHWTTYASLAEVIGTSPQPLGSHVATCRQCANAHRVLQRDRTTTAGFAWHDAGKTRDPVSVLQQEGLIFRGGHADKTAELGADQLAALVDDQG